MGQGEDMFSTSRNFASVEFTIPSGKSLAWSCWLLTKGVWTRSSVCASNWSNCVPNIRLEAAPDSQKRGDLLAVQAVR